MSKTSGSISRAILIRRTVNDHYVKSHGPSPIRFCGLSSLVSCLGILRSRLSLEFQSHVHHFLYLLSIWFDSFSSGSHANEYFLLQFQALLCSANNNLLLNIFTYHSLFQQDLVRSFFGLNQISFIVNHVDKVISILSLIEFHSTKITLFLYLDKRIEVILIFFTRIAIYKI